MGGGQLTSQRAAQQRRYRRSGVGRPCASRRMGRLGVKDSSWGRQVVRERSHLYHPQCTDLRWDPVEGPTDSNSIPSTTTPGALHALSDLLVESTRCFTLSARLSTEVTHIKGSLRFDFGWGCGYRNALMIISALVVHDPAYKRLFGRDVQGADPGVRRVQGWIEEAWAAGYDREGCNQLRGKVLGTRKWIGATDLYSMFNYLGVP